jgi:hypothetical protein
MKNIVLIVAAGIAFASGNALAFNPLDFIVKDQVENIVRDGVNDAVEKSIKDAIVNSVFHSSGKGNAARRKVQQNPGSQPTPEPGKVGPNDYRALPLMGKYRFPLPKDTRLDALKIGPNGGYLDRFGSEWIPYRINEKVIVAWRSNLSDMGRVRMRWAMKDAGYFLVKPDGEVVKNGR